MKITISAALLLSAFFSSTLYAQDKDEGIFAEPIILKVGEELMNESGQIMYPSPAVFDIDNDGKDELVIGSIFGSVHACENENNGPGDPVWSAPKAVNTLNNEPLALNNW